MESIRWASFLLAFWMASAQNLCPPPESTEPCGCVGVGDDVRLDCVGVKSIADTRRAILSVADLQNVHIHFLMSKFDEPLPSHLFDDVKLRTLSFTNCNLKGIGDASGPSFLGVEDTLEELTISFSFPEDAGLKYLNLSNLRKLEILEIEGNYIDKLTDDWFPSDLPNLSNLYFMTNFINELGDNVFANLHSARTIWLINNKFTRVARSMFPRPARQLTALDLSGNQISTLPDDFFTEMPALKEITLTNNDIQFLPESSWSLIWGQVSRLYLDENPLHCDDSAIHWMMKRSIPNVLKGVCETPEDKNGQRLKDLIDEDYDY